jgi:hypothetical protein
MHRKKENMLRIGLFIASVVVWIIAIWLVLHDS